MEGWYLACWLGKWRRGSKVVVVGILVRTVGMSRSDWGWRRGRRVYICVVAGLMRRR